MRTSRVEGHPAEARPQVCPRHQGVSRATPEELLLSLPLYLSTSSPYLLYLLALPPLPPSWASRKETRFLFSKEGKVLASRKVRASRL